MSSTATLSNIPADILHYHILPFIRRPTTFMSLGGVDSHLRRNWQNLKDTILALAEERTAVHDAKLKEIEAEIQVDPCPNLTKDLHFAGVAVSGIDFRTLSYDDADTLFTLSVFFEFLMLTKDFPTREEIEELLNKENAVVKLWNVNARSVPKDVANAVIALTARPEWRQAEERFPQGPESEIIKWIKLFVRYLTRMYEVDARREREDFHWRSQRDFRRMIKHKEKIWAA